MARKKRLHEGIVTSIYVEKDFREISQTCKFSDSDLWLHGLKDKLESSNTRQAYEKLLRILEIEKEQLQEQINIIKDKIGKTQERIKVKDYGSNEVYEIDEQDFDPVNMKKV